MARFEDMIAKGIAERSTCTCGNGTLPRSLLLASANAAVKHGACALQSQNLQYLPTHLQDLLLLLAAFYRLNSTVKNILKHYSAERLELGGMVRHFCMKCRHEMKLRACCNTVGESFQELTKSEKPECIRTVILAPETEINGSAIKTARLSITTPVTIRGKATFKDFSQDHDTGRIFCHLLENNQNSSIRLDVTSATLLWSYNDKQDAVSSALSLLPSDLNAIELKGAGSVCYEGISRLGRFKHLKRLTLELNDECGLAASKIGEMCKFLSVESLESTHKTFRGLPLFLKNIQCLRSLSVTNSISDEDLRAILHSRHVVTINDLYLCLNNFSQSNYILPLVMSMPQLVFLDLSYCEIEKEVLTLLCTGITNFKGLRSVRLKQFHLRLKRVASYEVAETVLRILATSISKVLVEVTVDATDNEEFKTLCREIFKESKFGNIYGVIFVNSFLFQVDMCENH